MEEKRYTANFHFDESGVLLHTEVCEGIVVRNLGNGNVIFQCVIGGVQSELETPEQLILASRLEAERKIQAALAWKERSMLKKSVEGRIEFLPDNLAKLKEC